MRRSIALTVVLIALLVMTGCAPGPNSLEKTADDEGRTAGFFFGLWHGLISPVTFVISVFSKNVRLYEVHNTGTWYNFGFVLGAGLFLSGGILGRRKKRG
ncbi:MAG: LPXTG cell wall anchor domain-containing protein [Candidatus Aminicenantes bacterium]|nr:MAG: LPXTG cell wall anchor domain-containing protein [Candidatus Aminicenantes bacterium]